MRDVTTDSRVGMGVAYHGVGSTLVKESERGIWKAGRRCPDIILSSANIPEPQRLYNTVIYGQFSVLSVGGPLRKSWSEFPGNIKRYTILPVLDGLPCAGNSVEGSTLIWESQEVHADEYFVVVVRPDMYIGCVGSESDALTFLSQTVAPT